MLKQKEFVEVVTQQKPLPKKDKNALRVYQELVFHRFYEVISNALPIFNELIETKRLEELIIAFIHNGARTPLIWQMPNEFRKFVKQHPELFSDMPYINDLLWFEWIEIRLFMQDYTHTSKQNFRFKKFYQLSKGARIKKLSYKVYEKEFTTQGDYFVLAYYDKKARQVFYREVSEFMYRYIKALKTQNANDAVTAMSTRYGLDNKEVKDVLKDALKELCTLGVLEERINND